MASRSYYQLAIHHPGLSKHRIIRGNDRFHVEGAAAAQQRAWAQQYGRKVEMDEQRNARNDKQRELEDNLIEAEERTTEARAALSELRGLLVAKRTTDYDANWAAMIQPSFSQPRPTVRPFLPLPAEPMFDPNAWRQHKGFVTTVVPFLAKRAEAAAHAEFEIVHGKWFLRNHSATVTNQKIYADNLRDFEEWQRRAVAYEEARGLSA